MSATAAAFAESGHGILPGMSTRPPSRAGDPMTLGNMRANGVRSLAVSCQPQKSQSSGFLKCNMGRSNSRSASLNSLVGLGWISDILDALSHHLL
jgi:hypothetical protein